MIGVEMFAYLDAGTGSLIIQSIVGIAAGVAVFGRRTLSTAVHKVRGVFSKSDTTDATPKKDAAKK